jgi:hypothetical protein
MSLASCDQNQRAYPFEKELRKKKPASAPAPLFPCVGGTSPGLLIKAVRVKRLTILRDSAGDCSTTVICRHKNLKQKGKPRMRRFPSPFDLRACSVVRD